MTILETSHLLLYAPAESEFLILRNLWKDEKVRKCLGGVISNEQIDKKISAIQKHWHTYQFGIFAVKDKQTERLIGLGGLHHSKDGIELSYMFFPEWWGQGLAFEAAKATLDYGFHNLQFERVVAITQDGNKRSCKMLERLGMKCIEKIVRFGERQRVYSITKTSPD